ncbi:DUF805 domain-containing protein [uncultured Maricaulis sp.]|uniref:DUF805 domain-containing protein n=1 Tax=uncultured Maricaulis sp. TaxID=174710 RepID=UPI0026164FD3|nr:DUF805 domain-containing protein [uncultured Maricaulis sp.]
MSFDNFILKPAEAKRILFGSSGKLSPQDFAKGIIAIVAVNLVIQFLTLLPGLGALIALVGLVVGLVSLYAWVCVYSKRFHDAGKSGWMTVGAIVGVVIVAVAVSFVLTPLLSGGATTTTTGMAITLGGVLASSLAGLIGNGVVGYIVYKM